MFRKLPFRCFECGHEAVLTNQPMRTTRCEGCDADVRACLNCRHYDPRASQECREPVAEPVRTKDRANFCDYFVLRAPEGEEVEDEAAAAKRKLEDLFGG